MGALTDVFVASDAELRAAFPSRVLVKPEPMVREVKNPFTGTTTRVAVWVAAEPFPRHRRSAESLMKQERAAYRRLPHREFKRLDPTILVALWTQLRGGDRDECMNSMTRPALLGPGDPDDWLYRFPDELVSALSGLPRSGVRDVASTWSDAEETQTSNWTPEDAEAVLLALTELARRAIASQRGLYLWVSL